MAVGSTQQEATIAQHALSAAISERRFSQPVGSEQLPVGSNCKCEVIIAQRALISAANAAVCRRRYAVSGAYRAVCSEWCDKCAAQKSPGGRFSPNPDSPALRAIISGRQGQPQRRPALKKATSGFCSFHIYRGKYPKIPPESYHSKASRRTCTSSRRPAPPSGAA